jgi:predicted DsbA family dithiol-disulfide isomerase
MDRRADIAAEPGTIVIFSDVGCPWAHLGVFRLHRARERVGLQDDVRIDHRAFPLELFNRRGTPRRGLDPEIPVAGNLDPAAGWQIWQGELSNYPTTMLPALEAVQAAKEQGLDASERLDLGLRRAFFGESRNVSLHHVILEVADERELDAGALEEALTDGRARRQVFDDWRVAQGDAVRGSPHLFLPDGSDHHHPGVEYHWEDAGGHGFPVVDRDDPSVYDDIVKRAATS